MPYRIVDIADMKISRNPSDTLVTYSLGSCVGVAMYDPLLKVGSMIHCMLPLSRIDKEKAQQRPYMFVDTGVTRMLNNLFEAGVRKSRVKVCVAGGAHVLNNDSIFRIGERNYTVLRKILWKNDMLISVRDVGGNVSRTIRLHLGSGRFSVKSEGQETHYELQETD